ncbi:MAG: ABC transporter permease subunit [Candidatus Aegiribacteria sp.]|nr:ABC transporter permease subunit [Candidatus Aegiribacteria sp.]
MKAVILREWLRFYRAMGKMGLYRFIAIYGIIFGFILPGSFDNPTAAFAVFALIPLYVAGPLAVDAIAGERERNTLETLLTAPLSPMEILGGKTLFSIMIAAGTSWMVLLLFTVWSIVRTKSLPSLPVFCAVLAGGLVSSVIGTLAGLHVSMKAKTVRSGQQWFAVVLMLIAFGIPLSIQFLIPYIPQSLMRRIALMFEGGWFSYGIILIVAFAVLVCAVLWLSLQRRIKGLWRLNPER